MIKDNRCDKWLGSMIIFIEGKVYPKHGKLSYSKICEGDYPKKFDWFEDNEDSKM